MCYVEDSHLCVLMIIGTLMLQLLLAMLVKTSQCPAIWQQNHTIADKGAVLHCFRLSNDPC